MFFLFLPVRSLCMLQRKTTGQTHDTGRDLFSDSSKNMKAIMGLASHSKNPEIRYLLVRLLNEGDQEMQQPHQTAIG
jgi:hypothetical protein